MPILLFFIPVALNTMRVSLFVFVLVLSILFALVGTYNPWPPVHEPEIDPHPVASLVKNPIGGNASAWLREYLGESFLTKAAASQFIHPDPEKQNQYFLLFYKSKGDEEMAQKVGGVSADQFYNKAMSLLSQNKLEESIAYFEQALKIDPDHVSSHNNLGITLARLGKLDRAIEHFKTAIRLRPDNRMYRQNLARAEALKDKEK
jgi:tetratricopeptide (TPR) repeat protein